MPMTQWGCGAEKANRVTAVCVCDAAAAGQSEPRQHAGGGGGVKKVKNIRDFQFYFVIS